MAFELDEIKAAENLTKHKVPFAYATRIFDDPYRIEREDWSLDDGESRYQAIGMVEGHVLFAACTCLPPRRLGTIHFPSCSWMPADVEAF